MDQALTSRKIVHIDMDAFYASVELRDDPNLRGKPVVVAWKGKRSVVCAASYEARKFGVRSAMPAITAERLCPDAVFIPPDFVRYKEASRAARAIFEHHTDLIEPLSLDEAYLVGRIPGVGKITETRMKAIGIGTVGNLYRLDLSDLENHFGSYGARLYQLARGIDHNPVVANRLSKSISAEDTFPVDIPLEETEQPIRRLAEKVWRASRENARGARTSSSNLRRRSSVRLRAASLLLCRHPRVKR